MADKVPVYYKASDVSETNQVVVDIRVSPPVNGFESLRLVLDMKIGATPKEVKEKIAERVAWKAQQQMRVEKPIEVELIEE